MSDFARRAIVRSALRLGEIAREEMRAFMERQGIIMAGNERKPFMEIVSEFEVAARDREFGDPKLNSARAAVFAAFIDRSVRPEDVVVHGLTIAQVKGTPQSDSVNLAGGSVRDPHLTLENVPIDRFDRLAVYSAILRKETNRKPDEVEYSTKCVTDVADRMLQQRAEAGLAIRPGRKYTLTIQEEQ